MKKNKIWVNNPIILAIDTATDACSAALLIGKTTYERFEIAPQQHTQLLLPMIESIMEKANISCADLSAIAFGAGPGSFTGLRIAAGVTQGIAFAHNLPVIPISILQTMAQSACQEFDINKVFVGLDARMGEIYWGVYEKDSQGLMRPVISDQLTIATAISLPAESTPGYGVGNAWIKYAEQLNQSLGPYLLGVNQQYYPKASLIAQLAVNEFMAGKVISAELAIPNYLRHQVVASL